MSIHDEVLKRNEALWKAEAKYYDSRQTSPYYRDNLVPATCRCYNAQQIKAELSRQPKSYVGLDAEGMYEVPA